MSFTLPIVAAEPARPDWHGFTTLEGALAAPEPDAPQGEYAINLAPAAVPHGDAPSRRVELLSPAGGPDAAFAAFEYGADAIYLGMKKFSARAEAENFTIDELSEIVAYAHALTPPRRVFVTINTLIRNDEVGELVETLAALEDIGVDALIVQDLGVYHLVKQHFPTLELHASTQLAVHNGAGAVALRKMGFTRVVLARELTFEEVRDITAHTGIETEVFIHGALCYSYSGLCLFSSQTLGRSGNRGKCAYSCRDSFTVEGAPLELRDGTSTKRDPREGFPFSMKDLALPDHVPALRSAGVSCFKIEGRKKSPLYVATATDFYRGLIDGKLKGEEREQAAGDLQSAFGRPWTRLFVDSHKDKEVADRDHVGHRGAIIGTIEGTFRDRKARRVRFRTARALEKHDGVQVDLPSLGKPFGFGLRKMWVVQGGRLHPVITAPAGAMVEVELPQDHRDEPELPLGSVVYCAASNAVKREYRHDRPKPGAYLVRHPIDIEVTAAADRVMAIGRCGDVEVRREVGGEFAPARDATGTESAAREAFAKLGDTRLSLAAWTYHNAGGVFVPVSRLNALRRELTTALEAAIEATRRNRVEAIVSATDAARSASEVRGFRWSVKTDRVCHLDAFTANDWHNVDEAIIDIARDHPAVLIEKLDHLASLIGRERIRLSLPPITRKWEEPGLLHKIERLRQLGWRRWEAGNVSAWTHLGIDPAASHTNDIDLSTDWSVYTLNRLAAQQLLGMGVTRFALSPEDGLANVTPMFREFGEKAVLIVHQDTPMFVAESCAYANLIGGCPGKANCSFESMDMVSSHGERVTALDYHCRTIVLEQGPFCLSRRLKDVAAAGAMSLRVDFIYRKYDPAVAAERWRAVRAGKAVPGGHAANFDRGVL